MSALPPDPAQWPDDPYQLFGVTSSVTRKDLRRRYSELIRQYKPEHAPDEFRRIRDAFEVLQQHVQWREQFASWSAEQAAREEPAADGEATEEPQPPGETASPSGASGPSAETAAENAADRDVVDAELVDEPVIGAARSGRARQALAALVDDAWNVAQAGDPPLAYGALAELHQQHAGDEEICVRLYWLLRLWPDVDAQRKPADWLYGPLIRHGPSGRVAELLRSHFEDEPAAALDPRCDELLRREAPPWELLNLASKRWQAAAALGRAEVVTADLAALRERLEEQTTREWWARALMSAVDVLAWTPGRVAVAALDDCQRQLEEMRELQLTLSHELDRRDLLRELAAGFTALRALDDGALARMGASRHELAALEGLLARWWRLSFAELRRETERTLHPWVVDFRRGLLFFDHLRQRAPAILSQLGDLIEAWHGDRVAEEERPADETAPPAVVRFFNRSRTHAYEAIRGVLLLFCIDEWIWPPQIMPLWATFPPPADAWLAALDADLPLRYLCQAYEAAWA